MSKTSRSSIDVQMLITMHSVHLIVLLYLTHDFSGHLSTHKIITMSIVPLCSITLSNPCTTQVHYNLRKWLDCNVSPQVAQNTRIIYGGTLNALHPLLQLQSYSFQKFMKPIRIIDKVGHCYGQAEQPFRVAYWM